MYADRNARSGRVHPVSLATSLSITGAMIAGLIFSAPHITHGPGEVDLVARNIPIPPPPTPEPPKPQPKSAATPHAQPLIAPPPQVPSPPTAGPIAFDLRIEPATPPTTALDLGPVPLPTASPTAAEPALVDPSVDPRYADALQPAYPAEERRAGREARITVRVLVGMDGRVKQIEPVGNAPESFLASTRRQALTRWRFRPGTRGGIPVEAWRTMTIRFVLDAE